MATNYIAEDGTFCVVDAKSLDKALKEVFKYLETVADPYERFVINLKEIKTERIPTAWGSGPGGFNSTYCFNIKSEDEE